MTDQEHEEWLRSHEKSMRPLEEFKQSEKGDSDEGKLKKPVEEEEEDDDDEEEGNANE